LFGVVFGVESIMFIYGFLLGAMIGVVLGAGFVLWCGVEPDPSESRKVQS
jgi:hypothetical protein